MLTCLICGAGPFKTRKAFHAHFVSAHPLGAYVDGDPSYQSAGAKAVRRAVYRALATGAEPIREVK